MYSGQKLKLIQGNLLSLDSKFVAEFPLRSSAHALHCSFQPSSGLAWDAQGMGAAGIRPQVGEGDFFRRALLEKKSLFRIEEEYGEGTVEEAFVDVGHEMTCSGAAN